MLIEIQIKDHEATISVDGRAVETSVANLNMVVRVLDAQRDHLTATQFFDAAAKDVDFRNPSEQRIVAFLRKVVSSSMPETGERFNNAWPEYSVLHNRGHVSRCIFCAGAPAYVYPTTNGVRWLAVHDGQDPEKAVQAFMAANQWARQGWCNKA